MVQRTRRGTIDPGEGVHNLGQTPELVPDEELDFLFHFFLVKDLSDGDDEEDAVLFNDATPRRPTTGPRYTRPLVHGRIRDTIARHTGRGSGGI